MELKEKHAKAKHFFLEFVSANFTAETEILIVVNICG